MRLINITLLLLQLVLVNNAQALAVDFENNGDFTTDNISGLDWYDVSLTQGLNYNEVVSLTSRGGALEGEGWRYATAAEFSTMLGNFLSLAPSGFFTPAQGAFSSLVNMLGSTAATASASTVNGRLINSNTPPHIIATQLDLAFITTSTTNNDVAIAHNGIILNDSNDITSGSFLVRTTVVPVPAAVWFMGTGMIGLIGFSRKKVQVAA